MITAPPASRCGCWGPPVHAGGPPAALRLARALPAVLAVACLVSALHLTRLLHARLLSTTGRPTADRVAGLSPAFTPQVRRWSAQIEAWADAYGLPAPLIATVMQIESCGDPGAQSGAGALGLFQVMPFHFAPGESPLDPETNARRGLGYLARALELAGGHVDLALAGYSGGHSRITQPVEHWPEETRRYVAWGTSIYADAAAGVAQSPAIQAWLLAGGERLCRAAADA